MTRPCWVSMVAAAALMAAGCGGPSGVAVEGKVVKGGAKYEVPADQRLGVTLVAAEEISYGDRKLPPGQAYMAVYDAETGSFTVPGPDGRGIPPGKYRVALTQKYTREAVDRKNEKAGRNKPLFDRNTDTLEEHYSEKYTPFVFDVDGKAPLTIDMDRPGGSPPPKPRKVVVTD